MYVFFFFYKIKEVLKITLIFFSLHSYDSLCQRGLELMLVIRYLISEKKCILILSNAIIGQTSLYLRAPRVSQPVVEQWVMCTLCSDETAG